MTEPTLLHRLFGELFEQTRRDIKTISAGFQGHKPEPFTRKTGGSWPEVKVAPAPQKPKGRPVELYGRRMLTGDSVELTLRLPDQERLDATPGQFVTLETTINGNIVRRPYSLSQVDGADGLFKVAVRHVPGGLMSTYLVHETETPALTLLGPAGDFGLAGAKKAPKRLLLIGAGSGVTPLLSMVEPTLLRSKSTKVDMILLNRTPENAMYLNELNALKANYPKRFEVRHWYSRGPEGHGRLNESDFDGILKDIYGGRGQPNLLALCGPDALQQICLPAIETTFPECAVSVETFTPAHGSAPSARLGIQHDLEIISGDDRRTLKIKGDQSILDAGLEAGIDLPFSCTVGGCGACLAKCTSGNVSMPELNALNQEEREEGYILTCVAQVRGDAVVEV